MSETSALEQVKLEQAILKSNEKQIQRIWVLIAGGLLLVCFALPLAGALAPRTSLGSGAVSWSSADVNEISLILRILGVMAFIAGLTERILLAIKTSR